MANKLWYQFKGIHDEDCPVFGKGHPITVTLQAYGLAEARREVRYLWGKHYRMNLAPISKPTE